MFKPLNYRVWFDLTTIFFLNKCCWHVVTCTADCTCQHLTETPAKNWNFWENWPIWNKYKHLAIPNDDRLASLKAFFILEQSNVYTWLYVPVTEHITIWHILRKIQLFAFKHKPQTFSRVCLRCITWRLPFERRRLPFKVYCLKIIKTELVYTCKNDC